MATVAAVIIGDELLSGRVVDANGPWLAQRVRAEGGRLVSWAVVPDRVDRVVEEIERALHAADWVVTSGGVGPTHDDITLEAVARVLGGGTELRAEIVDQLGRYGVVDPEPVARMATLPRGATLVEAAGGLPVVVVGRVIALPGVPRLFRAGIEAVADRFAGAGRWFGMVTTERAEASFAEALRRFALTHPAVEIGSYPHFEPGRRWVELSVEGSEAGVVERALGALADLVAGAVTQVATSTRRGPS